VIAKITPGAPPSDIQPFEVVPDPSTPDATAPEPAADGIATMTEMAFGLPTPLEPGRHWWMVVNTGHVEHELEVVTLPAGTTADQVREASARPEGTPVPAGKLDLSRPSLLAERSLVGGLGLISPGGTAWLGLDLPPGTYLAFCPIANPQTRQLHAAEGMFAIFTVVGEGPSEVATPAV
jgi:hypothetical protein